MSEPTFIDSSIPRSKAAVHALVPAAAFLIGGPVGMWVVGAVSLIMLASVVGGDRFGVVGRLVRAVRVRIGARPGTPDALAPHRFAEAVGAVFLAVAFLFLLFGAQAAGWGVALLVSALAALNWLTGICVGCQMYLVLQRLRSRVGVAQ